MSERHIKTMPHRPGFFERQRDELRAEGWPAVFRKIRRACILVLSVPVSAVAILVVIGCRLLRPIVVIRFGQLLSERIGHYAMNTERYLCFRDAGKFDNPRTFDIFFNGSDICNDQLAAMWDRTLHINRLALWLNTANGWLPGGALHRIPLPDYEDSEEYLGRFDAHLSFTPEEEQEGQQRVKQLGIKEDAPFVCFHARSPHYLKAAYPDKDWSYHDYRDSTIANCLPAMTETARRGYYSIRVGSAYSPALVTENTRIIDYATSDHQSDFMDIFLPAKCRFFVGDACGMIGLAQTLRQPCVVVNFVPIAPHIMCLPAETIYIPKQLWLKAERRMITLEELFSSGVSDFTTEIEFQQRGIEVIENTPDQILAVVTEMNDRIGNDWKPQPQDAELQDRFWSKFCLTGTDVRKNHCRVGAAFLRENPMLLD